MIFILTDHPGGLRGARARPDEAEDRRNDLGRLADVCREFRQFLVGYRSPWSWSWSWS